MDDALRVILDPQTQELLLTPEEFATAITACEAESSSAHRFQAAIEAGHIGKSGRLPDTNYRIKQELQERKVTESALPFLIESKLPSKEKLALLDAYRATYRKCPTEEAFDKSHPELAKDPKTTRKAIEYAARLKQLRHKDSERVRTAVNDVISRIRHCLEQREAIRVEYASLSTQQLAESIVANFYGDKLGSSLATAFSRRLAAMSKLELVTLHHIVKPFAMRRAIDQMFGAIDDTDEFAWIAETMGVEPDEATKDSTDGRPRMTTPATNGNALSNTHKAY